MGDRQKPMSVLATVMALVVAGFLIPGFVHAGDPGLPPESTKGDADLVSITARMTEVYEKAGQSAALLDAVSRSPEDVCLGKTFVGLRPDGTLGEMTGTDDTVSCLCEAAGRRFVDKGDGTVIDCLAGLVWLKNANCFGEKNFYEAADAVASLADGQCGLTDGSVAGDWRLPTKEELEGIGTDPPSTWYYKYPPVGVAWRKPGRPFRKVKSAYYRSIITHEGSSIYAWRVYMQSGYVNFDFFYDPVYLWPVRRPNTWRPKRSRPTRTACSPTPPPGPAGGALPP